MSYRIAIDIGGTFTDYVAMNEETGELTVTKASSTPKNFADGVMDAIEKGGISLEEANYIVHGSTIVINALTERKGAKTALITTKGYRDVLEIGRANRTDLYNYYYTKPKPFVPRMYRFEVEERMDKDGNVLVPLNEEQVKNIAAKCKKEGIEAIAVCLLHSYANSEHEEKIKEILMNELPGIEISISSEVIKEWREYERTNTTVFNAYVKPAASRYLDTLKERMKKKGLKIEPYAMQSNGGTATFEMAKINPINIIESGPVGGVIGANELGKIINEKNIITFDIGGTTAKTSLIYNNEVKITTDYRLEQTPVYSGYPVKAPIVDIIEIGAGGGSIAWIDSVGNLKVGPRSAGADPGPACYDRGNMEPTLTDANMIAGRIDPDRFLGGKFPVNIKKSYEAVKKIADYYKITVEEAARGIIRIANNNMMNALKLVSVRKGYDPREFIMVAMGGNGAIHSPALGKELKVKKIVIPRYPAVFSAWGMLMTDLRQDFIQTRITKACDDNIELVNEIYDGMIARALELYENHGIKKEDIIIVKSADIRYVGQEHTVKTPVPASILGSRDMVTIRDNFENLHEQYYTFKLPDSPIEFVNFNITAFGKVKKAEIKPLKITGRPEDAVRCRNVVDYDEYGKIEVPVYIREKLGAGSEIKGPAIVEEETSVTVLYPDQRLYVDEYGNLIIEEA
ncbi:hydantoinase/oxoprolinase family protein [Thermoanaerobacterium sp. DL9XJH110]|uniref:hydantoinase/oxoprolinase family protein n=1 Tax=Thermoanaerobacterium sp. DL9XJH110 TaxID=3386643 RepID=UPI003BB6AA5E